MVIMNFLRALIVSLIGVFLLMTLWPLFIFFILVLGAYWMYAASKFKKMAESVQTQRYQHSDIKVDEAIDVDYTEKEE
jgi:uncharacterized BrkB/YihY/UPF0761 family membrane protein